MDQQPARQIKSLRKNSRIFLILLSLLAATSNTLQAEAVSATKFSLLPNHTSHYEVEKFGTVVAEMQNVLRYRDGIINYTSTAQARGLATLFIDAQPKEKSILSWPNNPSATNPQQQSYSYFQEENHKKNQLMEFSYTEKGKIEIKGSYKKNNYTIETDKTVWSRQLLPLLMSSDLLQNPQITGNSFYITNKGHIKKYTYTLQENETIEFKNKMLAVLKFKITRDGSKRISYVWLSAAHNYLPLKIEQYKNGELNIRMFLTNLKLN